MKEEEDVRSLARTVSELWTTRLFTPYRQLVRALFDLSERAEAATVSEAKDAHRILSTVRRSMIFFLMKLERPVIRFSGYFSGAVLATLAVLLALKEVPPHLSDVSAWGAAAAILVCAVAGACQAMAERLRGAVLPQIDDARQRLEERAKEPSEEEYSIRIERHTEHPDGSRVTHTRRLTGAEAAEYDVSLSSRAGGVTPFRVREQRERPDGSALRAPAKGAPVAKKTRLDMSFLPLSPRKSPDVEIAKEEQEQEQEQQAPNQLENLSTPK